LDGNLKKIGIYFIGVKELKMIMKKRWMESSGIGIRIFISDLNGMAQNMTIFQFIVMIETFLIESYKIEEFALKDFSQSFMMFLFYDFHG